MKKIFLMFAFIVHVVLRSHAASAGVSNCPIGSGYAPVNAQVSVAF